MFKWLFAVMICLFLTSCIGYVHTTEPDYIYQDGYWYWGGANYYWVPGRYVPRGTVIRPYYYHPYHPHGHWRR